MKVFHVIVVSLVLVGALNWGLVGLFNFDLVAFALGKMSFGETNTLSRIVYTLVGISGVAVVLTEKKNCKMCSKDVNNQVL